MYFYNIIMEFVFQLDYMEFVFHNIHWRLYRLYLFITVYGFCILKDFVTLFRVNVDVVETDWYFDENGEIRCSYCDEKSYIQDQSLRRECYCSICGHKMSKIILPEKI